MKTFCVENMSTQKLGHEFIAALFIIGQKEKQPKCPPIDELTKFISMQRNGILIQRIINLKNIMPSERNQTQKVTCCVVPFT